MPARLAAAAVVGLLVLTAAPLAAKPVTRPDLLFSTAAVCRSPADCDLTLSLRERGGGRFGSLDLQTDGLPGRPHIRLAEADHVITWAGPATAVVQLRSPDGRTWSVRWQPPSGSDAAALPAAGSTGSPGLRQWGGVPTGPSLRRRSIGGWLVDGAPSSSRGMVLDAGGTAIGRFGPARGFRLPQPLTGDGRVWVYDERRAWSWPLSPSGQLDDH